MAEQFYTMLTNIGKAKIANNTVLGTKVNFIKLKVGDGGGAYYNPTENQEDLINTTWEGTVGSVSIDDDNPNWIVIETVLPASVGGFTIREVGIFDDEQDLIAITKCAETYKPVMAEGTTKEMLIRTILEVSNASSVTLKIDPTVILATKKDIQILESKMTDLTNKFNIHLVDNKGHVRYGIATGTANTYAVTLDPEPTEYVDGMAVCVKINSASTGASTLNVNGLGAKQILDSLGNPITSGGLKAGLPYTMRYNGTNFIVQGKGGGGDAIAAQLLLGKKATVDSGPIVGTIPSKIAATITPGTTNQTIAAGQYIAELQTILGDADLISANIKAGANIFNVAGKASVVDTADATALAAQIISGYTGYTNGSKITGTASIESLGGKRVITGSFTLANNTSLGNATITLGYQPSFVIMLRSDEKLMRMTGTLFSGTNVWWEKMGATGNVDTVTTLTITSTGFYAAGVYGASYSYLSIS